MVIEEKTSKNKESNRYFDERIAYIDKIRKSSSGAIKKIGDLASIAEDYFSEDHSLVDKCKEHAKYGFDMNLLFDTLLSIAEDKMNSHEVLVMDDFHDFVKHFVKIISPIENPVEVKVQGTVDPNNFSETMQPLLHELMVAGTKATTQQRDYYRKWLIRALVKIEQLESLIMDIEWASDDKPKEVEEQMLRIFIEIAKKKPFTTRQGIKNLLQDYVIDMVARPSKELIKELAALDNERPQPQVLNNYGEYNAVKHVDYQVGEVKPGAQGVVHNNYKN